MKNFITLSFAALIILLAGCNRNKIAQLELENQTLRTERDVADSLQSKFNEYLLDIESNLADIKSKEKIITSTTGEKPQSTQEKILQDLADISTLMDKNRNRLAELDNLRRQMKQANIDTKNMEEMVKALEARIVEQEAQIQELQAQLKVANEQIDALKVQNQEITDDNAKKQAKIDEQVIELNTVFYTMGTSQLLKEAGIITQKGGFIGLGKTRALNEQADLSKFTKVDLREFTKLETNSDKIELITTHPTDSYKINNADPKNLIIEITNPASFWKSSKYLVVRVR
ncbi:MAG: hypothetical protein LBU91_08325 [Bacteroidales bacterium]|jgi:hypothetical protein|nr:hypothetical protein [Bacteroidales bacterium]